MTSIDTSPSHPQESSIQRLVFFIVLLDVMGFGMIIPVQPFLAQNFGATAQVVTLVSASYSGMQFLIGPFWGSLSDRFGRRPILLGTILMTCMGHTAFVFANSLTTLFLARILAGIGAANISTAQAVIADTADQSKRSSSMAIIGAAFGVGFVFGPALGGILTSYSPHLPAVAAAVLTALNGVLVARYLPETLTVRKNKLERDSGAGLMAFFTLKPTIQRYIITTFLMITSFALMEQSLGLFMQSIWVPLELRKDIAQSSHLNAIFLVTVGVAVVIVQGFLIRRLLKRFSERILITTGLAIISTALILIPILGWIGSFPLFLISAVILAVGSGLFNPSISGLISKSTEPSDQGITLALNQSAASLGRLTGPIFAGTLFALLPQSPFLIGAALSLFAIFIFRSLTSKVKN